MRVRFVRAGLRFLDRPEVKVVPTSRARPWRGRRGPSPTTSPISSPTIISPRNGASTSTRRRGLRDGSSRPRTVAALYLMFLEEGLRLTTAARPRPLWRSGNPGGAERGPSRRSGQWSCSPGEALEFTVYVMVSVAASISQDEDLDEAVEDKRLLDVAVSRRRGRHLAG